MPPTAPRLELSSPADLLAAIPYLLGFHPADSLVLVGIRDRHVAVTFRVDLPPPGDATDALIGYLLDVLGRPRRRHRRVRLVLVGYGQPGRVEPFVAAVRAAFAAHDLPVLDALRVTGDRFWPLTDPSPAGAGRPFSLDSPVAAAATVAGMVALPDRAELTSRVAPVEGPARVAMERATHQAEVRWGDLLTGSADLTEAHDRILAAGLTAIRTATTRYQPTPETAPTSPAPAPDPGDGASRLTDDEVAWLGMVLGVSRVRDEAWGLADTADRGGQLALWAELVRRLEDRYLAPAAALLAYVAWQHGNGPYATVALDRALAADPDYPMAQLLSEALAAGMPPSTWHPVSPAELARLDAPPPTTVPPRRLAARVRHPRSAARR